MAEGEGEVPQQSASHIQLRVRNHQGGEVQFKIKRTSQLKKLMEAYCQRTGVRMGEVRFMVDGERINENDTPDGLGMADEDLIDCSVEQTGGGWRRKQQERL
ncbi:unnamed protein product [Amoebophrya sp. A25]|nr:unnamed protein product [Amoebophrya sp. A25]|eukprot:GSA25T00019147001.1